MKTFPDFHKARGTVFPTSAVADDDDEASGLVAKKPYLLGGLPFVGAAAAGDNFHLISAEFHFCSRFDRCHIASSPLASDCRGGTRTPRVRQLPTASYAI